MPIISNSEKGEAIYLTRVDQHTTAHDAARELWASVFEASKKHGGEVVLKEPKDGEWGFTVLWEGGPKQWADAYVVSEGASTFGFVSEAQDGNMVRFTDLS